MYSIKCWFVLLVCSIFSLSLNAQRTALPPGLDEYINKVLKTFEVPGLNLAIVKDGKALLTKGYGIKKLGGNEPVNEQTLFPIASNSKAFTGVALGLLVEEGKIAWDDPVIEHLPWFKLSDPYVTSQLSIKDLLVHRSGLAPYAGDLLQFPPSDFTREEVVKKMRWLPLIYSFRNAYAYDNVMYLVAGEVIKAVTGQEWEDFVQSRILDKLDMKESVSRFSAFRTRTNVSASHARFDGEVKEVRNFLQEGMSDKTNPAGGIASNAADMAKWMITQLDSGRSASGYRLYSPALTIAQWTGVTPMPIAKTPDDLKPLKVDFLSYGLGFNVTNYRNYKALMHGGKLDGFVSRVMMIPDLKLGITILTNQESGGAIYSIINHILDYYMQAPSFNWLAGYKHQEALRFARIAKMEKEAVAARDRDSKPSLPLKQYAGNYQDNWYGNISINTEGDHLVMRFDHTPGLVGDMEHFQYDTFIVRWRNRELKADAYVSFSLQPDGSIDQVKMKAVSSITDVSYDFHDLLLKPVNK